MESAMRFPVKTTCVPFFVLMIAFSFTFASLPSASGHVLCTINEVCRQSTGACDPAEFCVFSFSGTPGDIESHLHCPQDFITPANIICRPESNFACDIAEVCDGVSGICPTDTFELAGTFCFDNSICNGADSCDGAGNCVNNGVNAPDGTACSGLSGLCEAGVCQPIDADDDGILDSNDKCPGFDDNLDTDSDGVPDGCDLCQGFNDSFDSDVDGVPDGCETQTSCGDGTVPQGGGCVVDPALTQQIADLQTDLSTCGDNLTLCNGDLSTCDSSLATCDASLATCQTNFAAAHAELVTAEERIVELENILLSGKITICHKGDNTQSISLAALATHLAHGDTIGPCE